MPGRIIDRVQQNQQSHFLALGTKLLRDRVGFVARDAPPGECVRTVRTHLAQSLHISIRIRFHRQIA